MTAPSAEPDPHPHRAVGTRAGSGNGSDPGASTGFGTVRWVWDTAMATGAIAICRLLAVDGDAVALDAILATMTGRLPPRAGQVVHRPLCGIDDGIVVRLCDVSALVMPHGGIAIRRAMDSWLVASGASPHREMRGCQAGALAREALRAFPEASSPMEAMALQAISRASSPRAIPLLLAADARMRAAVAQGWRPGPADAARARRLSRLLRPPLVVAVGAANAGKSSLLNALAGRTVAIAADLPGTTRDCVAGRVILDGLAVDWLDTPGMRDTRDAIELQSRAIARQLARHADLIVGIHAPDAPWPEDCSAIISRSPDIAIRSKSDLEQEPCRAVADTEHVAGTVPSRHALTRAPRISVSALARCGLEELATAVRRALVPDADLDCPDPWIFDPSLA
jgi:tRNA modification GTPase